MTRVIPALRTRHFFFMVLATVIVFHIGAFVYDGWGWFWMGWFISGFLLVTWGFGALARIASSKMIWFGGSASLGPKALVAILPAILDEHGKELWPESECYALGGATLGGINIAPTGEYLICRRGLAIPTAPPGKTIPNYFVNGWAREISRPTAIKYRLYGDVRPHLLDPRTEFPDLWQEKLFQHEFWNWRDSVVWTVDMPLHPMFNLDSLGDFQFHAADGEDPFPLRAFFPTIDEFEPDTVLIDMVHTLDTRMSAENVSLRAEIARLRNAQKSEADHYMTILNQVTDLENKVSPPGFVGYLQDAVNPQGQPAEGVGRQ